jgi:hypothetical protein
MSTPCVSREFATEPTVSRLNVASVACFSSMTGFGRMLRHIECLAAAIMLLILQSGNSCGADAPPRRAIAHVPASIDFLVPVPDPVSQTFEVKTNTSTSGFTRSQRSPNADTNMISSRANVPDSSKPVVHGSLNNPYAANYQPGRWVAASCSEPVGNRSPVSDYSIVTSAGCSTDTGCDSCVWHCYPEQSLLHFRAEHLQWWISGMRLPPLASFSPAGTPVNQAGVLGVPGNTILYGGDEIFNQSLAGGRALHRYLLVGHVQSCCH